MYFEIQPDRSLFEDSMDIKIRDDVFLFKCYLKIGL